MAPEPTFDDTLKKWNWGAFVLNWVWCLSNMGLKGGLYKALLMFVPGVNLVMLFLFGARGNRWAWEQGHWKSQDDFLRTQKIWGRVGLGVLIGIPTFIALIFALVFTILQQSDAFELSFKTVSEHPAAQSVLGEPIVFDGWFISGSIRLENSTGAADLTYDVSGPKESGTVRYVGNLSDAIWLTDHHLLIIRPSGAVIDLGK